MADMVIAGDVIDQPTDESNVALVALTPEEMPSQQVALLGWCDRKIDAVQRELATFRQLEEEARVGGFRHATYQAAVRRTEKRIVYYQKIKAAVEAGYLIVPNMPVNLFAVRVKGARPKRVESDYRWGSHFDAPANMLPAGDGRYVDDRLPVATRTETRTGSDGKSFEKTVYFAEEYDEDVDFPLRGVHPRVIEASSKAMALKLFDELGVVQNGGGAGRDPIVVGRLRDPRGNNRLTTFFVAWWLNTNDL